MINNNKLSFPKLLGFLQSGIIRQIKGEKPYLPEESYVFFWSHLNPENTTKYVDELIKGIANMEQNQRSSFKALLNINKGYTIENLLATLLVITTFRNLYADRRKTEKELQEMKLNWQNHCSGTKRINACPYSSQIINNFFAFQMREIDDQVFISNLIGQLCFLPDLTKTRLNELSQYSQLNEHFKTYFSHLDNYTKILKSENQPYYSVLMHEDMELGESGELSFGYEYLLTYINSKQKKKRIIEKNIYDSIRVYMKHLPYIARDFPNQAEKSALALLHLTKQLFTFYTSNDHEAIRSLLNQIQIFRMWPYPVGTMASDLVNLLFNECKSHGNAFRQKVREEMPIIDFLEHENPAEFAENQYSNAQSQHQIIKPQQVQQQNKNQNQEANKQNTIKSQQSHNPQQQQQQQQQNEEQKEEPAENLTEKTKSNNRLQTTYIVADEESQESQYLIKHAQKLYHQNQIKSPHSLRASLIANMLSMTMKENKSDFEVMGVISNLSYQNMFLLYCRLLEIIEQCEELDSMIDVKLIQENAFTELLKEIRKYSSNNKQEYVDSSNVLNVIHENTVTFIPEFPVCYFQPLTIFNNINAKLSLKPNQYELKSQQGLQYLKTLLEDIKNENLPLHQEPLRIVVMGGDAELHNLVQILGDIFEEEEFNPETKTKSQKARLFLTLDLKIYLVPTKKLALAHFIAAKDPWYQRYLYIPFREEILAPRVEEPQERKDQKGDMGLIFGDKSGQILFPYELKLKALNTYLREAEKTYNVRVYKIVCNYSKNSQPINIGSKQNFQQGKLPVVYFCQYLEIGASVEAEIIKLQKKSEKRDKEAYSLYDMKEKKLIKFQYKDLTLITQTMDFVGNISEPEQVKSQIHNIRLNNVYKEYFEGNMPYPNVNWLELSYINYENSKIFDQNFYEKKLFKSYDRDQLQAAFKALYTSMPIHKMVVKDESNQGFDILVDGKIISGLQQIEITPLEVNLKAQEKSNQNRDHVDKQYEKYADKEKNFALKLPVCTFLPMKL